MTKITLNNPSSGFSSASTHIANNDALEDALNSKVLWRDNPEGEANSMQNDLDMNSNDILNAQAISTGALSIGGVQVTATPLESTELPTQVGNAGRYLTTNGTTTAWDALDSEDMTFTSPGTGGSARTVRSKLTETVSVTDFGATGDGSTDDTAAFAAALGTAGRKVYIPAGTYILDASSDSLVGVADNVQLFGCGESSLIRVSCSGSAGTRGIFSVGDFFKASDLKVDVASTAIGFTVVLFPLAESKTSFTLNNVHVDGQVVGDSAASHLLQVLKAPDSGTYDGIRLLDCRIRDVTRVYFRSNSSTCSITNIEFRGGFWKGSESSMVALNSPNGITAGVRIIGVAFEDPYISAVQSDSFFLGIGSSKEVTVQGCVFRGTGQEAIHLEESNENVSITGNVIDMVAARGIYVSDNSVGGSDVAPVNLIITGNVVTRGDASNTGVGIELVNDVSDEPAAKQCIVSSNVIRGWDTGLTAGVESDDTVRITNNIFEDCTVGLKSVYGLPEAKDNTFSACGTGISTVTGGGIFGFSSFANCSTNVNATDGEATLMGFSILFDRITATGSSSNTDSVLMPMSATDLFDGKLTAHVYKSDTNEDTQVSDVNWDGTTFTNTSKIAKGGGSFSISFQRVSDNLILRVFNGSTTQTTVTLHVQFDGAYVIS